jgi:adenosine deaminase
MSMESPKLACLIQKLPKADLHRHLEGSIKPRVILEIARENNAPLPTYDLKELRSIITIKKPKPNLKEFVKPLELVGRILCNREAVQRATYEVIKDAYLDNVKCLELTFNPAFWNVKPKNRLTLHEIFEGAISGKKSAEKEFTIKVGLIVGFSPLWKEHGWFSSDELLETALTYKNQIVGVNLVSELKDGTLLRIAKKAVWKDYVQISRKAKDEGLSVTAHAGEAGGPEGVRDAIENLGANRIGHGISIVKDREIMKDIIRKKIPLEICLTSNVLSGIVQSIHEHPFKELQEAGAFVTLNTDDPSLCQTNLTDEYMLATEAYRLDFTDIKRIIQNGFSATFISYI